MDAYDFEFTDFALSEHGVHLLRSKFNYQTIEYDKIKTAIVKKAPEIKNVILSFILGIALAGFGLLQTMRVIELFQDATIDHISIYTIVVPILPSFAGLYLIYISLKKRPILLLESSDVKKKLRLRDAIKANKLNALKSYLREKVSNRLVVSDEMIREGTDVFAH